MGSNPAFLEGSLVFELSGFKDELRLFYGLLGLFYGFLGLFYGLFPRR